MDIDYSFLHKILKDPTRRDILQHLNTEPLSYMELMNLSGVTNTGRFNYHLKAMGDLIEKTEEGKYRLTERGQLAVQLMEKFPQKTSQTTAPAPKVIIINRASPWSITRKELAYMTISIVFLEGAIFLLFFGVIFLKQPYPYGPISSTALAQIIVGACFLPFGIIIRRKYMKLKASIKAKTSTNYEKFNPSVT
jgi:hypothetical protein